MLHQLKRWLLYNLDICFDYHVSFIVINRKAMNEHKRNTGEYKVIVATMGSIETLVRGGLYVEEIHSLKHKILDSLDNNDKYECDDIVIISINKL